MNTADIILIILIALVFAGAVFLAVMRKKNGSGCCGDCEKCRKHK